MTEWTCVGRRAAQLLPASGLQRPARALLLLGLLLLGQVLLLPFTGLQAQEARVSTAQDYHVELDLVPEYLPAERGSTLWLALRLNHAERWHTYWINPGDAGRPTQVDWQLPAGVSAGEILWPTPERFDLPADLVDFGYTGDISLLIPLHIDSSFAGDSLPLAADVFWYECDEICIPGSASITLELPVTDAGQAQLNASQAWLFERTRSSQPRADISLDSSFHFSDGELNLLIQATEPIFSAARELTFIPDVHGVVDYLARQRISSQSSSLQLTQAQHGRVVSRGVPERVGGLLLVTDANGTQLAYQVDAQAAQVDASLLGSGVAGAAGLGIGQVFLFAMLGGLILNLMPCVFPILSLKVLSLASAHGAARREQRLHGLAYTVGVMASFLALAALLLSLQAGGAAIGWGFQLQQSWVVALLIFVFFVMGLSLSGVVEFGTSIMGIGSNLQEQEGLKGSFFTGVLATVVASPCTAPFMGAALGFAFTQSMPVALAVFLALGFGMALPFLLLSFVPGLGRLLPRPGAWMQTFRQVLAFPLYATAVWLLWVVGNQSGPDGMALVLLGCVLLAFACWLWQQRHARSGLARQLRTALALGVVLLTGSMLFSPFLQSGAGNQAMAMGENANFEPYTAARLAELRAADQPVFVNMTAAWCITCLVNEKLVLSSEVVVNALASKGVTYLKGDWTNNDPAITEVLRRYETAGVPLYLLFPADGTGSAEVLPQILTESIVLDALARI